MKDKVIFLDFDGTLTDGSFHIWKFLWKASGYSIDKNSYYAKYKKAFNKGEISYFDWCEKSLRFFKEKGLTKKKILRPVRNIKLIGNVKKFIKVLHRRGYEIFILSGNFKEIIAKALGKNIVSKITYIQANEFCFKEDKLDNIIVNDCDYDAKPKFVEKILKQYEIKKNNAIFIGNGKNDELVKGVGIKTICINAEDTDYKNNSYWDNYIFTNDFLDVLNFID